jgi:hypothetical protein
MRVPFKRHQKPLIFQFFGQYIKNGNISYIKKVLEQAPEVKLFYGMPWLGIKPGIF